MKSRTELLSPRPVPSAIWTTRQQQSFSLNQSKLLNMPSTLPVTPDADTWMSQRLDLVSSGLSTMFLFWNVTPTTVSSRQRKWKRTKETLVEITCAFIRTCRIWLTALRWSPAVILSRSLSTQCCVALPQPLTNSWMLQLWVNTTMRLRFTHLLILNLTCHNTSSTFTWEHTAPQSHPHKLSRACPPHRWAGLERLSSSEGFERCRHCWEMSLHTKREEHTEPKSLCWLVMVISNTGVPLCLLSSLKPKVVNPGRSLFDRELRSTLWVSSSAKNKICIYMCINRFTPYLCSTDVAGDLTSVCTIITNLLHQDQADLQQYIQGNFQSLCASSPSENTEQRQHGHYR